MFNKVSDTVASKTCRFFGRFVAAITFPITFVPALFYDTGLAIKSLYNRKVSKLETPIQNQMSEKGSQTPEVKTQSSVEQLRKDHPELNDTMSAMETSGGEMQQRAGEAELQSQQMQKEIVEGRNVSTAWVEHSEKESARANVYEALHRSSALEAGDLKAQLAATQQEKKNYIQRTEFLINANKQLQCEAKEAKKESKQMVSDCNNLVAAMWIGYYKLKNSDEAKQELINKCVGLDNQISGDKIKIKKLRDHKANLEGIIDEREKLLNDYAEYAAHLVNHLYNYEGSRVVSGASPENYSQLSKGGVTYLNRLDFRRENYFSEEIEGSADNDSGSEEYTEEVGDSSKIPPAPLSDGDNHAARFNSPHPAELDWTTFVLTGHANSGHANSGHDSSGHVSSGHVIPLPFSNSGHDSSGH
nr:hypothetical protein [Endozoicomonas sp.]